MTTPPSFLPEDYLAEKAERRTNLICLVLFAVVMLGVFFAFVFTNQKWSQVKRDQATINARYQTAAQQITELTELEQQKEEMLQKADLAAALVERVPRSILLAELINRMPERLSLLELKLTSEKLKPIVPRKIDADNGTNGQGNRLGAERARTKQEAAEEQEKVRPPRYLVRLTLVGVAPTDLEVSRYLAELNAYPLLRDVTLAYSEEKEIEDQVMREFEIAMRLETDADVRDVEPLIPPRPIRDPMSDELQFTPPMAHQQPTSATAQAVQTPDDEGD